MSNQTIARARQALLEIDHLLLTGIVVQAVGPRQVLSDLIDAVEASISNKQLDLAQAMELHRIAISPEAGGPWTAQLYGEETEPQETAEADTVAEAVHLVVEKWERRQQQEEASAREQLAEMKRRQDDLADMVAESIPPTPSVTTITDAGRLLLESKAYGQLPSWDFAPSWATVLLGDEHSGGRNGMVWADRHADGAMWTAASRSVVEKAKAMTGLNSKRWVVLALRPEPVAAGAEAAKSDDPSVAWSDGMVTLTWDDKHAQGMNALIASKADDGSIGSLMVWVPDYAEGQFLTGCIAFDKPAGKGGFPIGKPLTISLKGGHNWHLLATRPKAPKAE